MTKQDIATRLYDKIYSELTLTQARHATQALIDVIYEALCMGESIYVRGFGTLNVKDTPARCARNINKGTMMPLPAAKRIKFKPCRQLIRDINDNLTANNSYSNLSDEPNRT